MGVRALLVLGPKVISLMPGLIRASSVSKLQFPGTTYERVHKTWLAYIAILVVSAGFMVYGLWELIHELHLGYIHIVTGVLSFASNVLLDTLVGCDAIIAAMYYFRNRSVPDPAHQQRLRDAEVKLDVFCG